MQRLDRPTMSKKVRLGGTKALNQLALEIGNTTADVRIFKIVPFGGLVTNKPQLLRAARMDAQLR